MSSDLAEAPPLPGSPRSTGSPPPGGYSSHTSSASESDAVAAGLAHGLGGFSSAGWLLYSQNRCVRHPASPAPCLLTAVLWRAGVSMAGRAVVESNTSCQRVCLCL